MCFPAVMMSHPWPSAAPHWVTWTGVKLARKSPESLSTERHLPSEVCWYLISLVVDQSQPKRETYLDVDIRRGSRSSVVPLMSLSHGGLIKGGDCSGVDDWVGGGEGRRSEERDQLGIHGEGDDIVKMNTACARYVCY